MTEEVDARLSIELLLITTLMWQGSIGPSQGKQIMN